MILQYSRSCVSSSSNAKKWEVELQTLKNNNARLTAALQESTANVEEWKKQLAGYKDETSRLKKKVGKDSSVTSIKYAVMILVAKVMVITYVLLYRSNEMPMSYMYLMANINDMFYGQCD